MDGAADAAPKARRANWKQDPDAVRADILRAATGEFAARGLSGGRIDEIARRTRASKRMIYYYFGDKEGLYKAVLEGVYTSLRQNEERLKVEDLPPVEALARLVEATFDAHAATPTFIRLVMIENIHNAAYLRQSEIVPRLNRAIIDKLADVCARGREAGLFRDLADPLELHWLISAPSFYNVSNRATFTTSFGEALYTPASQARLRRRITDMILGLVVIGHEPGGAPGAGPEARPETDPEAGPTPGAEAAPIMGAGAGAGAALGPVADAGPAKDAQPGAEPGAAASHRDAGPVPETGAARGAQPTAEAAPGIEAKRGRARLSGGPRA